MTNLFSPLRVGRMELPQRIAMAPMTRFRADNNHLPLPCVTEYYRQRASVPGSLLITEATVISPRYGGYANVPSIHNEDQIAAWKHVTEAVHAQGSSIYMQLWALGRAGNPQFLQQSGYDVVSSSNISTKGAFSGEMHHPRALSEEEIWDAIADFAAAATNAIAAGFDGVEIHGANGYLVDQFTQDVSNVRTDSWGGSIENRSRFALEVTRAVVSAIGNDRTAIRLSPWGRFQDMRMSDPVAQFSHLADKLAEFKLAYLHLIESDARAEGESLRFLLDAYGNASPVVLAGNYTSALAKEVVDDEYKDRDVVIAFGRPYISNPDVPFRVKNGIPFADSNPATIYGQSPDGYTDYGFSEEFRASL
ncbi:hypothetical protein FE257_006031 [Aspergillus nanangensis]|uniref:NADH:flavin oxidoreductase/NADH oxidase N-terminal domain-containing protein n=1 Tax=Aspergillus nanangensis TaxID=2582783 RepID=A0AAD4CPN7_ASPNN|nr:hypothetical protein FE257_006031 [Aspergillus nanangensis]